MVQILRGSTGGQARSPLPSVLLQGAVSTPATPRAPALGKHLSGRGGNRKRESPGARRPPPPPAARRAPGRRQGAGPLRRVVAAAALGAGPETRASRGGIREVRRGEAVRRRGCVAGRAAGVASARGGCLHSRRGAGAAWLGVPKGLVDRCPIPTRSGSRSSGARRKRVRTCRPLGSGQGAGSGDSGLASESGRDPGSRSHSRPVCFTSSLGELELRRPCMPSWCQKSNR